MVESTQPPTETRGEQIKSRLGSFFDDLEAGVPIPFTTVTRYPDGVHERREGLLGDVIKPEPLKDFTLTVEVKRNENGEVGRAQEQLTAIDMADAPGLVVLAGTLGDQAHQNLERTD